MLSVAEWQARLDAHRSRAEALTAAHLARRRQAQQHPIFDFLFEYYPVSPGKLARWHPGRGETLAGDPPHAHWRDYARTADGVGVDLAAVWARRGESISYIKHLLERTATNPAHFDCFGLHEWAMVYRTEKPRHNLPLRLGRDGTNDVVETHRIRCTHYDAFRFFTPAARPLNFRVLQREDQPAADQSGCLHATMDLYKWAAKLGPLVPGELWLDTFELARDVRILDMEASPYDCREYGFHIVAIETPEGKAEYVARQRELAERAAPLRQSLIDLCTKPTM
ncbi:3-methyladenine DNA glycosylase [Corynebacterium sp.]|uniref:3-methyladenine DNA glycosylase n=1 Tax=Corynebacterium sp. TaxID=1720 RepID=UPI0026DD590B|nr:3-methyladenine DNA glycosylase [Corynebacterium sp.]MDO5077355.1 3-methyladenine DNA glycosylase [Corynebacterium sp.]